MFSGSPVAWKSRKQHITTLSTTEAEYVAAAECAKEAKYLKSFYEELTKEEIRLVLMVDSQSTIHLMQSGQMNRRTKHIDVRYHFLSEKYHEVFDVVYCSTEEQVADIFTKPLTRMKFERCRDKMMKQLNDEIKDNILHFGTYFSLCDMELINSF